MANSGPKAPSALSPRVWAVAGIPLLLLVLASGLLLFQVVRLKQVAELLEHSDEAIALCVTTERNLRAEQAARVKQWFAGKDDVDATTTAAWEFAIALRQLVKHFSNNPAQSEQVSAIGAAYRAWRHYTAQVKFTADSRFEDAIQASEKLVDEAAASIRVLEREERRLRTTRAAHQAEILSTLIYTALPMLLLLALAISINARRETFRLARDFNEAMGGRQRANNELELQGWVREQLRLLGVSRDDIGFRSLGERVLHSLIDATDAVVGSMYVVNDDWLELCATHGIAATAPARVRLGAGLLGEAAKAGKVRHLQALPGDYLEIESSLGSTSVSHLVLVPCDYKNEINAAIELAFLEAPSERSMLLLEQAGSALGMAVAITSKKVRMQDLLIESRRQAEALQLQQEELHVANEELSSQSEALKTAHAQLEVRKTELERSNLELTTQRNALDETRKQLEAQAMELRRADRYKSEFLASMSHELRTPLNSILILSKSLSQADPERLTAEEIRYAETIHASGNDLLALINDVLELSKIEAGAIELNPTETTVSEIVGPVLRITEPLARDRALKLQVEVDDPALVLTTDVRRVQQILKNLLSNACKFTPRGRVTFRARREEERLVLEVEDSGLGIAPEHQESIFEAFRQVDARANRRFSGTGLGLSISRDLARNLGGDVTVTSELGRGSRFTVTLPLFGASSPEPVSSEFSEPKSPIVLSNGEPNARSEDRALHSEDGALRQLLVLAQPTLSERIDEVAMPLGFHCVRAANAAEVVSLASKDPPAAIIVDLGTESASELEAIEVLREDPRTASVPVHVIGRSQEQEEAGSLGAVTYLENPVDANRIHEALQTLNPDADGVRRVLVVEANPEFAQELERLLAASGFQTRIVSSVAQAVQQLRESAATRLVTALDLPDAPGYELLRALNEITGLSVPSVVVYTDRRVSEREEQEIRRYSDAIILKGQGSSERLLDEITMFLHRVKASPPRSWPPQSVSRSDPKRLLGRKLLLVEDDVRSVFTLTSVLERQGAELSVARNGQTALQMLEDGADAELILMDLTMPEMDGLEATRRIRQLPGKAGKLPIIALTARAATDVRDHCIKAGASDYASKPVELDRLVSLIRIWLSR